MRLSEAIAMLCDATLADGRSKRTAEGYRSFLGYLQGFLGDMEVEEITVHDLRRYAAQLHGRTDRYGDHPGHPNEEGGLSTFTIASYLRSVKRLFNWLEAEGIVEENPSRRLKLPRAQREGPKAATLDDFRKLVAATAGDSMVEVRDRAILFMLADTACRVGGLAGLSIGDVDLDAKNARVMEKGSKVRLVYYSEHTKKALEAWLAVRPAVKTDRLFLNLGTKGTDELTVGGFRQILRRLKRKAKAEGPVNPHAWRHAFAREYLRSGGDLATLSDILGHEDVSVTASAYAVFLPSELQQFHARYGPIANLEPEPADPRSAVSGEGEEAAGDA